MLKPDTRRAIIYSQAAFYVTLIICVIIAPSSLTANSGISYFGHHRWTVAPFELGIFISAYFLLQAWRQLAGNEHFRPLYYGLAVIIPSLVGIAIAPAVGNGWLDLLHRVFGTLAFVAELLLGGWLVLRIRSDLLNWALFGLQWAGGIIAFIYLSPPTGYSIEGQLLFQLAFSAVLLRTLIFTE